MRLFQASQCIVSEGARGARADQSSALSLVVGVIIDHVVGVARGEVHLRRISALALRISREAQALLEPSREVRFQPSILKLANRIWWDRGPVR